MVKREKHHRWRISKKNMKTKRPRPSSSTEVETKRSRYPSIAKAPMKNFCASSKMCKIGWSTMISSKIYTLHKSMKILLTAWREMPGTLGLLY